MAGAAQAAPRVLSLDQCADQYVLALSPRAAIVGLSTRADDPDSRLRDLARGLPQRRTTLESALSAKPDLVVRYWGGDPRFLAQLEKRGARVVTIEDASDFGGVRANVRRVASAMDRRAQGEAVIARMDARLDRSAGAWRGATALYVTPGGFTGGEGTLVHQILKSAGLTPVPPGPGFQPVSLEQLALSPPRALVLGFFDDFMLANNRWGLGRHGVMRRVAAGRTIASLPGSMLGCPDPSAAEAVEILAARAPR
ncbi:ABC transporter substrate-binding protein [Phenylobacterium ferrooxidans]|uniref:ABC transporter substrate-binding protein n=1 Tax=Phenylobacterium ferrooxidans TaxID=2982689 RepID=A0ABW6CR83_9CAUL